MTRTAALIVLTALGPLAGCSTQPVADAGKVQAAATTSVATSATAAPAESAAPGLAGAARTVTGKVLETMDAASYTYVRVDTGAESIWAAAGKFDVAVGDRVVVPLETPMENFHSETLNRDFPLIYFASAITREGAAPTMVPAVAQTPMSSHPPAQAVPVVTEPIAQPAGGTPIANVWANRKALAGKTVTVRGKVVKFNGGILDHNWIHLQDGTGKAADRTNDLTVTTAMTNPVKVGDVITVTGVLAVDKDFGAGYAYPVIIEEATIVR